MHNSLGSLQQRKSSKNFVSVWVRLWLNASNWSCFVTDQLNEVGDNEFRFTMSFENRVTSTRDKFVFQRRLVWRSLLTWNNSKVLLPWAWHLKIAYIREDAYVAYVQRNKREQQRGCSYTNKTALSSAYLDLCDNIGNGNMTYAQSPKHSRVAQFEFMFKSTWACTLRVSMI